MNSQLQRAASALLSGDPVAVTAAADGIELLREAPQTVLTDHLSDLHRVKLLAASSCNLWEQVYLRASLGSTGYSALGERLEPKSTQPGDLYG